jgi:DNA repair protein RecO (recombination protein O)
MASRYQATGIVLDRTDYRENDQVFDVYTEEFGKIKILGKATRKIKSKLRSGMGIMSYSKIEFIEGKAHKILTDAQSSKRFKKIFGDLIKIKFAYCVSDVSNQLTNFEEKDCAIFELINDALEKIENCEEKDCKKRINYLKVVYYYFFWKLVSHLGYRIDLYNCCVCNKKLLPYGLRFSHRKAGIVCLECQKSSYAETHVSPNTIKIIRALFSQEWDLVTKLVIDDADLDNVGRFGSVYLSYIKGTSKSCK